MVLSPLIWWQSLILIELQTTSISPKMLQTIDCRFLLLTDDGILTTYKHSFLLYCSWLWRPLSSEVTHFNDSLLTVLVTSRDDPTWANLLERLSTVEVKLSICWPNVSITLSLSLCRLRTKLIRFSFLNPLVYSQYEPFVKIKSIKIYLKVIKKMIVLYLIT